MASTTDEPVQEESPGVVLATLRYWRTSLLLVVSVAALVYGASLLLPETYAATTRLGLTDPRGRDLFQSVGSQPDDLEIYTRRQARIVSSLPVRTRVAETLGDIDANEVSDSVSADASVPGDLYITGSARTPRRAKDLADAAAAAYREVVASNTATGADNAVSAIRTALVGLAVDVQDAREGLLQTPGDPVLQAQLDNAQNAEAELTTRANQIRVNAEAFGTGVEFVDPATTPTAPSEPKPLRNAAVGALFGLLLAAALAWVRADRHRAADDDEAARKVFGIPSLGDIPELPAGDELAALTDVGSRAAAAYQFVTASLHYVFPEGRLLVTSAARGDGKTVTAASVAAAAAREGRRVLLVDGDVRGAGLTQRLLGATAWNLRGLTDLLEGRVSRDDAVRTVALIDGALLDFMPAGSSRNEPNSLFRGARIAEELDVLRERYGLIVIDTPAFLSVADATSLAEHADGILLVVRRRTPLEPLHAMARRLPLVSAPLVGYVFTHALSTYLDSTAAGRTGPRQGGSRRWRSRGRQPEEARFATESSSNGSGGPHAVQTGVPAGGGDEPGDGR